MPLSVTEVTRIAGEAARAASPSLEVAGVSMSGGSGYSEVLVTIRGCRAEPCQVAVGVFRDMPEAELRDEITASLRRRIEQRPA